jgi:pimeloyl-ACP methyl ester carboxylesterase
MVGSDLRGLTRLTLDGIAGLVDVVEAIHHNIASGPGTLRPPTHGRVRGITGLVYRSIRKVIGLVAHALDLSLAPLIPLLGVDSALPGREALLAALNGVLGDYLARSKNPLAISMHLCYDGRPLALTARGLAAAIPRPGKLLLLAHGLCMNDLQWNRRGHDHGAALARDLGYTPVYLRYNSGLHVSANGRELAELLEALLKLWPVPLEELVLIGHSMGGLVCRSACHYGALADHAWRRRLRKLVFLGTPHHGAPLERGGNWVEVLLGISPYVAPLARLGKIRSAGITDLRYGNLLDSDWEERDRFERSGDRRRATALPGGVLCYTLAATTGKRAGALKGRIIGDGIVPLASALGLHPDPDRALGFPSSRRWIGYGMSHLDLLSEPEVYERIKRWLEQALPPVGAGPASRRPRSASLRGSASRATRSRSPGRSPS